jgi:hypothetical protein
MSILACFCEDFIQCVPYWRGFANTLFDASCHPSVLACVCEQITPRIVSYFASACVGEQNIRYITCASTASLYNNVLSSASPRAFANKLLRSIRQVLCAWRKIHSARPLVLPFRDTAKGRGSNQTKHHVIKASGNDGGSAECFVCNCTRK